MRDNKISTKNLIRKILLDNLDGKTIQEISKYLPLVPSPSIKRAVAGMADVYVDRWVSRSKALPEKFWPVHVAITIPEDAPYPNSSNTSTVTSKGKKKCHQVRLS